MEKPDKILKKVNKYLASSQFTEAMYALQDALMEDSRSEELLWKLVEVYGFMKDDANAVNTIRKIISNDQSSAAKIMALKYLQNDFPTFFPRSKYADMLEFEIHMERKDVVKAIESLRRVTGHDIEQFSTLYLDKLDKLKKIHGEEKTVQDNVLLAYQIFGVYYAMEKFDEAFDMLNQIAVKSLNEVPVIEKILINLEAKDTSNPYLYYHLGQLLVRQNKVSEAIAQFTKGVEANTAVAQYILPLCEPLYEQNKTDAKFVRFFALLHYHCGQFEKTFTYFDVFATLDTSDAAVNSLKELYEDIYIKVGGKTFVLLAMVKLLIRLGDFEGALRKFLQIRSFDNAEIETIGLELLGKVKEKGDLNKLLAEFYISKGPVEKAVHYLGELFASDASYSEFITEKMKKMEVGDNKEYLKLLGDISVSRNDLKEAFTYYKKLEEVFPEEADSIIAGYENLLLKSEKSIKLRQLLIDLYMKYEHYKKALKMLGEVLMIDPSIYPSIYPYFNTILEKNPDVADKVKGLLDIISKGLPNNPYLLFNMGCYYFLQGNSAAVIDSFKIVMNSSDPLLKKSATEIFFKLLEKFPHDLELRWVIADTLYNNKLWHELISHLNTLYLDFPAENPKILASLHTIFEKFYAEDDIITLFSKIAFEQNRLDELSHFIEDAEKIKPHSSAVFTALAELHFKKGSIKDVVKDFQKLLKYGIQEDIARIISIVGEVRSVVKPNPGVYYVLGAMYQKNGSFSAALELYRKVIGIEREKDDLIEKQLSDMAREATNDPQPKITLGVLYMKYARYDEAIVMFNQAVQLDEALIGAIVAHYEEVARKAPDRVDFKIELARIYALINKPEDSYSLLTSVEPGDELYLKYLQTLKTLTEQCPAFSRGHHRMADLLWDGEKFTESLPFYTTVLTVAPKEEIAEITHKISEKVFAISLRAAAELYCDCMTASGTLEEIVAAYKRLFEQFGDESAPYLDSKLSEFEKGQNDEAFADLLIDIALLRNQYDKALNVIKLNYDYFSHNREKLLYAIETVWENNKTREDIFDTYVTILMESNEMTKMTEVLPLFESLNISNEKKAQYALLAAQLAVHDDRDVSREWYAKARGYLPSVKKLYKLIHDAEKSMYTVWITYYELHKTPENMLKLVQLYLKNEDYAQASVVLNEIVTEDATVIRKKQYLRIKILYFQKDYAGVLALAPYVSIDIWNIQDDEKEIVHCFISSSRELRLFATARAYVHCLKGSILDEVYDTIQKQISADEARYAKDTNGYSITF